MNIVRKGPAIRTLILSAVFCTFQVSVSAESLPDSVLAKLQALVSRYDNPDEPGYAIVVVKDRKLVFSHAGGLANVEYAIPLTTKSVFNIASISKQFTATSVAMLALEGKLSLDDPVTFHIPELPELYNHVKISHLIHMESGIRDFYILHHLRGHGENVYSATVGETIELLARQKALYFAPGNRSDYSNSNYLLLAEIVQRVSGKSLREFARERIFQPLGMENTHFHDDRTEIVKNRATAYYLGEFSEIFIFRPMGSDSANIRKGFKIAPESFIFDLPGQSQLYTTVEDLYLWDRNFYTCEIGGKDLIELLYSKSVLNNGEVNNYAFGLVHGTYGAAKLRTVSHTGGTNGYLSNFIRFPDEEFSVIFMTNSTGFDDSIVDRVIEVCLGDKLSVVTRGFQAERRSVAFESKKFDAYSGKYELFPGFAVAMSRSGDRYFTQPSGQEKVEIYPSSDTTFFLKVVDAQITFHPDQEGRCNEITWHQGGQNYDASRISVTEVTPPPLNDYPGTYYSDELDVAYEVFVENGMLYLRYKPWLPVFTEPLVLGEADKFYAQAMWRVEFERDSKGLVHSMILAAPVGVGKMSFLRMDQ